MLQIMMISTLIEEYAYVRLDKYQLALEDYNNLSD